MGKREQVKLDGGGITVSIHTCDNPKAVVVLAGATAVPEQYYFPFSAWLVEQGYHVVTFNYRGTGRDSRVKHSRCRKLDWFTGDIDGVLKNIHTLFPDLPLVLLGHSAGAQGLGFFEFPKNMIGFISVCASSGFLRNTKNRFITTILLKYYLRLSLLLLGYGQLKHFGFGLNLAPQICNDWIRWCSRPGYVHGDASVRKKINIDYPIMLTLPVLQVDVSDDPYASDKNINDFWRFYSRDNVSKKLVSACVDNKIGHIGFFNRKNKKQWGIITEWLQTII